MLKICSITSARLVAKESRTIKIVILLLYLRIAHHLLAVKILAPHKAVGGKKIGRLKTKAGKSRYNLVGPVAHAVQDNRLLGAGLNAAINHSCL